MLCLDEGTPVIMALSLAGSIMLIVGGSLWGSGDAGAKYSQMAAGVGLFCASLVLLAIAGVGCWCNKCFCTPERKSRLAERFYGKKPATAAGPDDVESSETADCGSLGSSFRSFRSFRSSRRSVRASTRRARVQPVDEQQQQQQQATATTAAAATAAPHASAIPEQPEPDGVVKAESSTSRAAPAVQQTSIDDVSGSDVASSNYCPDGDDRDSSVGGDKPAAAAAADKTDDAGSTFVSC